MISKKYQTNGLFIYTILDRWTPSYRETTAYYVFIGAHPNDRSLPSYVTLLRSVKLSIIIREKEKKTQA